MDLKLTDKRVLVTGSNRGTGLVIAEQFSTEGAEVIVHGPSEEDASATAEKIKGSLHVWGDISTEAGCDQVIGQVTSHGELDILINNYGTAGGGRWFTSHSDDWIRLYQQNTLSIVRLINALVPAMIKRGSGRIINLGTVGSSSPNARMPHYYAAKGALANLTVGLTKELSGTGVTINLVSPGLIRTPEVESAWLKRGQEKGWGNTFEEIEPHIADNPIGRVCSREEVADLVVFLASERSTFVNGQNIRIDGGALSVVN